MTIINSDSIKNLYYANILYEIHKIEDKLSFFKSKYKTTLDKLESDLKNSAEDFEKWDDFMEWKAFHNKYQDLSSQKADIENGNYKVS
jgi:hypothetical protein